MSKKFTYLINIFIVLVIVLVIRGLATLSLNDLGTYDNSTKSIKETVNANNTLTEIAVNTNLAYHTAQTGSTVTTSNFTPRYIGDTLVDTADDDVWIASGTTTNDWQKVDN